MENQITYRTDGLPNNGFGIKSNNRNDAKEEEKDWLTICIEQGKFIKLSKVIKKEKMFPIY